MLEISRRSLIQLAATTAATGALAGVSRASTASAQPGNFIDTHHHIFAPGLQDWLLKSGILPQDRSTWPNWAKWSLDETIEMMERTGIAGAVTSQPAPFPSFRLPMTRANGSAPSMRQTPTLFVTIRSGSASSRIYP